VPLLRDKRLIESELLVIRWKRGDLSAFAQLVKLWEQSLFYYLCRLTTREADAWEILQETWLKIFKSLKSIRDPSAFPAFLYRTTRNLAIARLRRPDFFQTDLDSEAVNTGIQTDAFAEFDNAEQVHHALQQLPLLHREILTLYFLRELSLDEIATLLNIPIGTVKSRLHYARLSVRKILTPGETRD
jgi:RNA polymerase sigma-70 factor (ECF subfamily)